MKKILFVLKSNIYSGAEHVVCDIITHLPDEYEGIYMSPSGTIDSALKKCGIRHLVVDKVDKAAIKKAVREENIDVVHANDFSASVATAGCGVPVISHLHHNPFWLVHINPKTIAYALCSRKFRAILGVSQSVCDQFVFRKAIKNKFKVMGNPFDVNTVLEKAEDSSKINEFDLLYVGRMEVEKNPLDFIEAVAEASKELPNVKAVMVGDGSLRTLCEDLVVERELEKHIKVVGFKSNPYVYMAKTKVLVMPSIWEGFGLVALEAMALSKPVIATRVGGLQNLVNDECGALCSTPVNFYEIAQEIVSLLSDEKVYEQKSKAAKERALSFSNMDQYVEAIVGEYENACR